MSLIKKILLFDPLIQLGCAVWNLCMDLVSALFGITPTNIGGGKIWAFMVGNIYPTFLAIGASLLCIFFLIGFCKEAADIRLVLNAESSLMMFVRLVVSNAAVTTVLAWAPVFFVMATDLTSFGGITDAHFEAFEIEENAGLMTVWTLSFLFCMVAIIGGMMIVFCVYKRAFNLILLLPMAPIALSTLAGGQGISRSADAWFRTFLGSVFDIVIMYIALLLGSQIIQSGGLVTGTGVDVGFLKMLDMSFCIILLASAVKGSETLIRRAFAF